MVSELVVDVKSDEISIAVLEDKSLVELQKEPRSDSFANAKKVRRLYHDSVLAGFAGSVADAFTLFEKFEGKLEAFHGNLQRAAVELAKEWRTDRILQIGRAHV